MIKYARVINAKTGIVEIALGDENEVWKTVTTNIPGPSGVVTEETVLYKRDFYESIGMTKMSVEQGHDGVWYIEGKAPEPPETKTVRTFSKFSIWVATRSLPIAEGSSVMVWDAFEKFLNDAGLWTGWNQLVDLVEDNPFFEQFYPLAVEAFGKELVDNVLAAAVTSTKQVIVEREE